MIFPGPGVIIGISMSGLAVSIDANVAGIVVASCLEEYWWSSEGSVEVSLVIRRDLPAIHPRIPPGILGKSRIAEIPTSDDRFKSPKGGQNSGAEFYTGHSPIPRELT
jgi:hypothetical protein